MFVAPAPCLVASHFIGGVVVTAAVLAPQLGLGRPATAPRLIGGALVSPVVLLVCMGSARLAFL